MEQLTCFFHPNREANKKCIKCGKFLCLECQKVLRTTSGRAMSDVVLCSECVKRTSKIRIISMSFGVVVMIGVLIFMLNKMGIIDIF